MQRPLADILRLYSATAPQKWTPAYVDQVITRTNTRIRNLRDRTVDLPQGRASPELDQVAIGSGKHYMLAVLFLDICGFSSWPSSDHPEQATVLRVMNVFMAEMMNIVRDFGGMFEKNTGDGLMAYFGADSDDGATAVRQAVEAAVVMHAANDGLLSPWLVKQGFYPVIFRVGINYGEVTIGKVGVPGGLNSFVAIGTPANVACKIMRLIPDGGICIGNEVYRQLPVGWDAWCVRIPAATGFVYKQTGAPYAAWQLNYRLALPTA
jgi:class 3 adenylate cyclase